MEREKTKRGVHGGKFLKQKGGGGCLAFINLTQDGSIGAHFQTICLALLGVLRKITEHTHTHGVM